MDIFSHPFPEGRRVIRRDARDDADNSERPLLRHAAYGAFLVQQARVRVRWILRTLDGWTRYVNKGQRSGQPVVTASCKTNTIRELKKLVVRDARKPLK